MPIFHLHFQLNPNNHNLWLHLRLFFGFTHTIIAYVIIKTSNYNDMHDQHMHNNNFNWFGQQLHSSCKNIVEMDKIVSPFIYIYIHFFTLVVKIKNSKIPTIVEVQKNMSSKFALHRQN